MIIQVLLLVAIVAVVVLLGRSSRNVKHMAFRRLFLLAFAAASVLAILFPHVLTRIAQWFGVGRGADLLLYALVIAFVGSLAMQSRRATELGRMITLNTRQLAILQAEAELRREGPLGDDPPLVRVTPPPRAHARRTTLCHPRVNPAGPQRVRPTRRALDDLRVELPDLGQPLDEVAHPVVVAAQKVPQQRDAGGAERVLSLTDRVWFKVKTSDQRAIVTHLNPVERPADLPERVGAWWLGAAGRRQNDSPQRDFYAAIQREATQGATVSTEHLLPADWDWKRLRGEGAVAWRRTMRRLVIHLVATSMTTGAAAVAEFRAHRIKALVRAHDGEAYLAIIAEGIDPARAPRTLPNLRGRQQEEPGWRVTWRRPLRGRGRRRGLTGRPLAG